MKKIEITIKIMENCFKEIDRKTVYDLKENEKVWKDSANLINSVFDREVIDINIKEYEI